MIQEVISEDQFAHLCVSGYALFPCLTDTDLPSETP